MTATDASSGLRPGAGPAAPESSAGSGTQVATSGPTPPRVPMRRVLVLCAVVLAVETAALSAAGHSPHEVLLASCLVLMVAFGLVFCLAAVTVAGFAAGAAAAGLVLLDQDLLLPVVAGAALLALGCGIAPGWARIEAWQVAHSRSPTAEEEAAIGQRALGVERSRGRSRGVRLRDHWRADRVVAAFLVLAFHPLMAASSLWFIRWATGR